MQDAVSEVEVDFGRPRIGTKGAERLPTQARLAVERGERALGSKWIERPGEAKRPHVVALHLYAGAQIRFQPRIELLQVVAQGAAQVEVSAAGHLRDAAFRVASERRYSHEETANVEYIGVRPPSAGELEFDCRLREAE